MSTNSPPEKHFGGTWTENKLVVFQKYVQAYLTILNRYKILYNWTTIYLDAFAGCGNTSYRGTNEEDREDLYQGSPERVLSLDKKFDRYIFNDIDQARIESLKQRLQNHIPSKSKVQFLCEDANTVLSNLAKEMKTNHRLKALVMVDPFGMQVDYTTLALFKKLSVDLWLLAPTGQVLRQLPKKSDIMNKETLSKHLGIESNELEGVLAKAMRKTATRTLFDNVEMIIETDRSAAAVFTVYREQLKKIFNHVIEEPLELKNSKNVTMYHFAFASKNEIALKIANEIIHNSKNLRKRKAKK